MWTLFADSKVDVAEWVKTAGLVLTALLIPAVTLLAGLYFRKRDQDSRERKQQHELTDDERKQARKEKSEDEKNLDKQRDKIYERLARIEEECRRENAELRDWITALYSHITVERTLVGRWMGKVTGWMDYAAAEAAKVGLTLNRLPDLPPDLPDPPPRPERDDRDGDEEDR